MSDKKLAENLGTTVKIIRTSINKLNNFNWFNIDTKANVKENSYGGKTRNITIDIQMLEAFLDGTVEPIEEIKVIAPKKEEKPLEAPKIAEEVPEVIEEPKDNLVFNNFNENLIVADDLIDYYYSKFKYSKNKMNKYIRIHKTDYALNNFLRNHKAGRE
jgi:hypothetical protein